MIPGSGGAASARPSRNAISLASCASRRGPSKPANRPGHGRRIPRSRGRGSRGPRRAPDPESANKSGSRARLCLRRSANSAGLPVPHLRDGLCRIACRITAPLASASVTESSAIIVADLKDYMAAKQAERERREAAIEAWRKADPRDRGRMPQRGLSAESINKTLKVLAVARFRTASGLPWGAVTSTERSKAVVVQRRGCLGVLPTTFVAELSDELKNRTSSWRSSAGPDQCTRSGTRSPSARRSLRRASRRTGRGRQRRHRVRGRVAIPAKGGSTRRRTPSQAWLACQRLIDGSGGCRRAARRQPPLPGSPRRPSVRDGSRCACSRRSQRFRGSS